jgi:DNA modification methylase
LESESVDLIYLDPPFFSNRNYEVIWGDANEMRSFEDRWMGGIEHYIAWLKERVEQMYRVLKKTGSLFLHCDWHADAYIRVDILGKIFGKKNFRNAIIWKYFKPHSGSTNFPKDYDTILFYTKSNKWTFNYQNILVEYDDKAIQRYDKVDKDGKRYKIYNNRDGTTRISYMKEGGTPTSVFEIPFIQGTSKEKISYPTQKPEALLERIIKCASNEGDMVLDPFVGGGTTVAVAERLGRQFIGIDQSAIAIKITETRLQKQMETFFSGSFSTELHKYSYHKLRYEEPFEFEEWIIQQAGGVPNVKKRGDLGLDGKMSDNTPIQVKRSDGIGRNVIDNFKSAVERADKKLFVKNVKDKKPVGCIIAFSFSKGAREEAARLKTKENVIIELKEVKDIVPIAEGPAIRLKWREVSREANETTGIEFSAQGESESDIGFYSWDFNYDAEKGFRATVIKDEHGTQTYTFSAGIHEIAVKAVDVEGLESMATIKLKVNGIVKKM